MIGTLQEQVLKVEHVACNVERYDLASSVSGELTARSVPVDQQTAFLWPLALPNDVRVSARASYTMRQGTDGGYVFWPDVSKTLHLRNEAAQGMKGVVHCPSSTNSAAVKLLCLPIVPCMEWVCDRETLKPALEVNRFSISLRVNVAEGELPEFIRELQRVWCAAHAIT
ncbi:hypothetical protein [Sphingomonas sp. ABOLE]|uniref:hypothetical protein n=1 Tax=Sphingomonas sp. ABOLE TaxID=1985878 RepID=UPI001F499CB3|nr:hypothetical protein [Sphingomonas sp. ABOLE]